ncbi:hypothetical protein [Streptosporangium sp. KLBMP 9127]|nr:hypothetical protein [Streptosporangium sp. KLBMP 9127]
MKHPRTARHATGRLRVKVPRRVFDGDRQAAAASLDRREPHWVIWYGVASRRFYAAPIWECPGVLIVKARNTMDLVDQMRAAEDASRVAAR